MPHDDGDDDDYDDADVVDDGLIVNDRYRCRAPSHQFKLMRVSCEQPSRQ